MNLPIKYKGPSYNEMSEDFSATDCIPIRLNDDVLGVVEILRCGPRVIYRYSYFEGKELIKSDVNAVGNFEDLNQDFEKFIVMVKEYLYNNKKV